MGRFPSSAPQWSSRSPTSPYRTARRRSAAIARAAGASEEQIAWTADFQRRLFAAVEASEDLEPYREELGVAIRNGIDRLSEAQRAPISDVDGYVQTRIDQ